jgi:hypothetical protein
MRLAARIIFATVTTFDLPLKRIAPLYPKLIREYNLKNLSRRTWATAKRKDRLLHLINIYGRLHNLWLDRKKKKPKLEALYIQAQEGCLNI